MTVGLVRSVLLEVPTLAFQFLDFEDAGALQANVIAEALVRFKAGIAWAQRQDSHDRKSDILMTVERELVIDKRGQVLIPRFLPAKDMNERYNSGMRPIFGTTPPGREDGNNNSLSLGRDKERGDYYLEEYEKPAYPDSLQVTHSLLLAYWIKGIGHAHISLVRNKAGVLQLLLSSRVASAIRPLANLPPVPIERGEAFLRDSDSIARFLVLFALNILATSIVADIPGGERLVVYEPEPAFAAIIKAAADDRGVNTTIITSTMTSQRCEFLGWLLIHPQAPARVIQNILPKRASVFLVCNSAGHQAGVASITARIIANLSPRCRAVYMSELCEREASIQSFLDEDLHALQSHLRTATFRAQEDYTFKEIRTVTLDRISEITPSKDSITGDIAEQSTVIEWGRGIDLPVRIRPIDDQTLFSGSKTFWLAGLTGTLGLSLCEWMTGRGARYFVITSRTPKVSRSWLERMSSLGAVVKIFSK